MRVARQDYEHSAGVRTLIKRRAGIKAVIASCFKG